MEYNILKELKNFQDFKKKYKNLKNAKNIIEQIFGDSAIKFINFNRWEKCYNDVQELIKLLDRQFIFFALLELDNPYRAKILGLNDKILENKKEIKKWYRRIVSVVHPDHNFNSKISEEAIKKINSIKKEIDYYEE
ncbi:hypothetical protein CJ209_02825 [Fusobacterium nucleatum]|uniref:J domain-containing protein n=1 Tax=Fusobacterium nucleatum TaxID=851 RepID=A0A2N6TLN5_FUSNU|nr:DnaJ domain-containing protein [Fusobacterium nucleatum]PMC70212.1 hypothetical protein CJ209_02825 [Fusobacterium nucleatum]